MKQSCHIKIYCFSLWSVTITESVFHNITSLKISFLDMMFMIQCFLLIGYMNTLWKVTQLYNVTQHLIFYFILTILFFLISMKTKSVSLQQRCTFLFSLSWNTIAVPGHGMEECVFFLSLSLFFLLTVCITFFAVIYHFPVFLDISYHFHGSWWHICVPNLTILN